MAGDFVPGLRHGARRIGISLQRKPDRPRGEGQTMHGEDIEDAPETGSAAIFERILDEGASSGNRWQADDLGREIVLGMRIPVQHVPLAAFLVVERNSPPPWRRPARRLAAGADHIR